VDEVGVPHPKSATPLMPHCSWPTVEHVKAACTGSTEASPALGPSGPRNGLFREARRPSAQGCAGIHSFCAVAEPTDAVLCWCLRWHPQVIELMGLGPCQQRLVASLRAHDQGAGQARGGGGGGGREPRGALPG